MVIAWYHPPDYWLYQAWLQRTCLQIMQQFENEGIEFAFPSRTIYMADHTSSHMQHVHKGLDLGQHSLSEESKND